MKIDDAIAQLKAYLEKNPQRYEEEQEVIRKFGSIFSPDALDQLTKEQFKSFLLFKKNKHWDGIHRQGNMVTEDMPKLRKALKILLNEKIDLKDRLDELFPKNKPNFIKGLGRAVITPILMVVYPDKYGVYNNISEDALQKLGLHPTLRGESFAERYIKINSILTDIAQRYDVSLFQLDWLGYIYEMEVENNGEDKETQLEVEGEIIEDLASFGLEKHLEDFLVYNWEKTSLGRDMVIFEEDGDMAQQYDTRKVGKIDILARDKKTNSWVVIELKKGRDSDTVVGQTLRYMGWVKENMAKSGEKVCGIIITGEPDDRIIYALKAVSNIKFLTYKVKFELKEED